MQGVWFADMIFIATVRADISAADHLPLRLMVKRTSVYDAENSTLHHCLASLKDAVRERPELDLSLSTQT